MNEKLIEYIISRHDAAQDKPLASYLAHELAYRERVRGCQRSLVRRAEEIACRAEERRVALQRDGYALVSQCRHWDVTFHPDASGGNDSSYVCNDCGLDDRHIERGRRLPTAELEDLDKVKGGAEK